MNIITGLSVDTVYTFTMQTELWWLLIFNLNYWIGVHINFAQSRMPALVCNLQSEYGYHQARSQGDSVPQFQSFQVNKIFEV